MASAIAAIAPTIDADDNDVAYAMSATFLFDMAMIAVSHHGPGTGYDGSGLWHLGRYGGERHSPPWWPPAGLSEAAGDFATMVKLTRTLAIISTVIVFALVQLNLKLKGSHGSPAGGSALRAEFSIKKIFPWSILGFLAMSIVASIPSYPLRSW